MLHEVVQPVLAGMREEGHPYRGFLYCGLMLTATGPMVIEFNARLGDPEAQVILPLLDEPLLPLLDAAAAGALPRRPARLSLRASRRRRHRVGRISRPLRDRQAHRPALEDAASLDGVEVCTPARRSTRRPRRHQSGGRVLTVVGRGRDYKAAIARAYAGVDRIKFEGAFARRDIGKKAIR